MVPERLKLLEIRWLGWSFRYKSGVPNDKIVGRNVEIFMSDENRTELATFGAGCFWGVEETFRQTAGVLNTAVGYEGGNTENPTYKEVCTDRTGHAEVVQVEFDPSVVSYDALLEVFWANHNPTQVNRQGPDFGTQYRTVIFFHSPEQEATAQASKQSLAESGKFSRPIATEIVPAQTFYRAEEYHQQYLAKRGMTSCHL